MPVVSVILDIPSRSLRRAFTYDVPTSLAAQCKIGCAVVVEFGSRIAVGWVVETEGVPDTEGLKPILEVLTESYFDRASARIALQVAREYCAPPVEALRLLLPPGATPRVVVNPHSSPGEPAWHVEPPAVAPVDERWVSLSPGTAFEPSTHARVQRAVLDALSEGPVSVAELKAGLGAVDGALRALEGKGAVEVFQRRRFRSVSSRIGSAPRHERLSSGQQAALDAIEHAAAGEVVLLQGVTGSGKTEVYLRAIESVLESGRAAIVLVPEISLTPQTVGRFRARFGESVGVLHSRLGAGERRDEWDRIAMGQARVVVGARSALFAPVSSLGLIIIDEEHSHSYKQGQAPRYDARDVAGWVALERGCPVVMGSATPSMERMHAAREGVITRVLMDDRVGGGVLPEVEIVDMAAEFNAGHRSMFSRPLSQALLSNCEAGLRAVLLLNRRGFASFLLCRECGFVPNCPSCSTSLTYHDTRGGRLVCHHCGGRHAIPPACPECSSPYLRLFGAGTQRVEQELRELLPDTPIVRMDADTTSGKGGHERVLAEFESLPASILVGTQMVAKGLDYPDVGVVGVLNADTTLHLPDFRSAERTFQLLSQVAGRAGRSEAGGRVIVQTYWPEHPAVLCAARHDPEAFFDSEASARAELHFPPFGRVANIVVAGEDLDAVREAAARCALVLREEVADQYSVLGPSPAPHAKLKKQYRYHVLVKGPSHSDVPALVDQALSRLGRLKEVSVAPDIDPVDLL